MNTPRFFLLLLSLLLSGQLMALEATRTLNESADPRLQRGLEEIVEAQGLASAIKAKQLALVLVVVTDPEKPRLAELNGRNMIYAASLPKIAILLGAAVAIDEGRLEMDDELRTDVHGMIRSSCNACATRVLEQVGRQELIEILQLPEYKFYDHTKTGGLWVGKDYGPSSAYQRDPLSGLSHGATAFQAARFYYKLQTGTLVSPEQSEMMLNALSNPAINHKFVKGLAAYPELDIYRKSGTWKTYHADSALVRTDGLAYIMIALANHENGGIWLEQMASAMHKLAVAHNTEKP